MNEKLALSDEILLSIGKPERYIGGEVNSVIKDLSDIKVRFAFCFPDVYEIGMSHLGIQILYGMFNEYKDVWCERVYSPWDDLDKIMRRDNIPLFSLESQDPVKNFDFLGFTFRPRVSMSRVSKTLLTGFSPAISKKSVKKIHETIRSWKLTSKVSMSISELAALVNPVIQGWINYYSKFNKTEHYQFARRFFTA